MVGLIFFLGKWEREFNKKIWLNKNKIAQNSMALVMGNIQKFIILHMKNRKS